MICSEVLRMFAFKNCLFIVLLISLVLLAAGCTEKDERLPTDSDIANSKLEGNVSTPSVMRMNASIGDAAAPEANTGRVVAGQGSGLWPFCLIGAYLVK